MSEFPSIAKLKEGAQLHTIAHAIWSVTHPLLAYEVSWDTFNYNLQNSMGGRGTITFGADDQIVGVFFGKDSPRNPYKTNLYIPWKTYFAGAPENIVALAEQEATQYILDTYAEKTEPIITTAFWSFEGRLHSHDTWQEFLLHSDDLLAIKALEFNDAMAEYRADYDLSNEQEMLIEKIFRQRQQISGTIILSEKDCEGLNITMPGIQDATELLNSIDIYLNLGDTK